MPDKPEADSPATAPVVFEGMEPIECCAACKFWHRDKLTKANDGVIAAPCRRFPKMPAMATQIVQGPRGAIPMQSQTMLPAFMGGTDWCGEFKMREAKP